MKISKWAFTILLVLPLGVAPALAQQQAASSSDQSQSDSPAAAARRAQEQKKKNPPKSGKVWDNDNLHETPGNVNVVGQTGAPGENAENPPAAEQESGTPATPEEKSALEGDVSAAKAQLQTLKTDLDILQRKYALDQQTYYGKTGYASDKAGAAALADEKNQIDAKQAELADAQKKIDDLQARLDAAKKENPPPAQ